MDHGDCSRIRTKDLGRVLVQIIWDRKEGKRKVKKKGKKKPRGCEVNMIKHIIFNMFAVDLKSKE